MALAFGVGVRQALTSVMPRLLKRLTLAFAVFALGLLLAGFVIFRTVAGRALSGAEPVKQQLVFDWEQHANELEQQLTTAAGWDTPSGRTPPELGCQLKWLGESTAVEQHVARCANAPPALDFGTLAGLEGPKDQLLVKLDQAPESERDFGWMQALHAQGDWSQVAGTPLEFFDPHEPMMEAPVLSVRHVRGLALLRLVQGQRKGELAAAALDVEMLSRALLRRPFVLDQLLGVEILERSREVLAAAGHSDLSQPEEVLKALRASRLAGAMLWHPWVPKLQRDRFLPKLPAPSRCAAASEALVMLELGPLLKEQYPAFLDELQQWRKTNPCQSEFVTQSLVAREALPERSWKKLLGPESFVTRAEQGEVLPALLLKAVESTELGRKAVTELILSVITARPFGRHSSS